MSAACLSFVQARYCRQVDLTLKRFKCWLNGTKATLRLTQSLEKLALQYPDGKLTLVRLEESLSRHNFTLRHFTLEWCVVWQRVTDAQEFCASVGSPRCEPVILLRGTWPSGFALLLQMQQQMRLRCTQSGGFFDKHRIWQSKKPLYNAALTRSFDFLDYFPVYIAHSKLNWWQNPIWTVALATNSSVKRRVLYPSASIRFTHKKRVIF